LGNWLAQAWQVNYHSGVQETSLHVDIKSWYSQPGDMIEAAVDGYIIDIVRADLLIEIQTRSFSKLKSKLAHLLDNHRVHLVHSIPQEKWIVRMDSEGKNVLKRRKSPKHGHPVNIFKELVGITTLLKHPNLSIEILITQEEEIWRDDGRGSWRRKGWSIANRRLLEVLRTLVLTSATEYHIFLPDTLPGLFTVRDLAASLGQYRSLASRMAYTLKGIGVIERINKKGRQWVYRESEI
jgi:hypothetical protein